MEKKHVSLRRMALYVLCTGNALLPDRQVTNRPLLQSDTYIQA